MPRWAAFATEDPIAPTTVWPRGSWNANRERAANVTAEPTPLSAATASGAPTSAGMSVVASVANSNAGVATQYTRRFSTSSAPGPSTSRRPSTQPRRMITQTTDIPASTAAMRA